MGNQTTLYSQKFSWFAASFLLLFIASKSIGMVSGYAIDDYVTLVSTKGEMRGFLISQGRFTFALMQGVMDLSGLKQPELAGLGFFLSAGGLILICWMTLARWLEKNLILTIAAGAFLGAHSFFAEYVSFRQSLFPMGICFALISGAIFLLAQNAQATIGILCAAAGLAAIASGINQLAMAFFCIAVLGISLQNAPHLPPLRAVLWAVRSTALAGAMASAFYLSIFGMTLRMAAVDSNARMSILGLGDMGARCSDIVVLLMSIFDGGHPLVGPVAAICTALAICVLGIRLSLKDAQWVQPLAAGIVMALGIALALLPAALSGVWWPMPRTLVTLPLAVALGIAMLSTGASRFQVHAASGMLFIAVAIFSGKSGALLLDQQRLNRWDIALAREIISRVSEGGKIDALTPILIHRTKWAYEVDQGMPIGDANISVLSISWAVDALFEEATGRRLNIKLGAPGDTACDNKPSFPDSGSIHQRDDAVHVCL